MERAEPCEILPCLLVGTGLQPTLWKTGVHPFDFFFQFFTLFKDSDGLPLAHNSTEETPHGRTPLQQPALHTESPPAFLETLDQR